MNRLSLMHTGARSEFPASLAELPRSKQPLRDRTFAPLTSFYLGIAGFMGCSAVVIVTACLIALRIQ